MKSIYSILIISALFFTSCKNNTSNEQKDNKLPTDLINNPATASADSGKNKDKVPAFHFDVETHDFGSIVQLPARVDLLSIPVRLPPAPDRIKMFKRKSQGIDP